MPTILKNYYALYLELFPTPSVDRSVTFYGTIKLDFHGVFKNILVLTV